MLIWKKFASTMPTDHEQWSKNVYYLYKVIDTINKEMQTISSIFSALYTLVNPPELYFVLPHDGGNDDVWNFIHAM